MSLLRGITWEHPRGLGGVVAAATEWNRTHPDLAVEWEHRSLQAFAEAPLAALAEHYDLLVVDHPHVASVARDRTLIDFTAHRREPEWSALSGASVGRSFASYTVSDGQYALPIDAAAQVSAHRPDLLADPPRSWDDVLELARDGRVLWPAKPIDAYSSLLTVAANAGTPAFSRAGEFLPEPVLDGALALLRRLAASQPTEAFEMNPIEVSEELASGDRFVYSPLLFGYTNYSREAFRRHRIAYRDMPDVARGGSLLGGAGIAVSSSTAHRSAAVAHAFWLASASVQAGAFFDGGGQPAHADAWDHDRLNALTLDFFRGTRQSLESAWVRPPVPGYLAFQDRISPLVTAHLTGALDDRSLRRRIDEEADELAEAVHARR